MTKLLSGITRYSIFVLLVFAPLARGSVHGWAVSIIHVLCLIALTALLLNRSFTWNWNWIKTPLDGPILAMVALSVLSATFSIHPTTSLWATVLLLSYVAVFYLIIHSMNARARLHSLAGLVILIATFLSIFGLFKRFGLNPFPWWDYSSGPAVPPSQLMASTYGNSNHFAGYLEMAMPLTLGLILGTRETGKRTILIYLMLPMLAAFVLTLSRGGWLGAFFGFAFFSTVLVKGHYFGRLRIHTTLIGISLFLFFVVFASRPVVLKLRTATQASEDSSLHSRLVVWGSIAEMIRANPLLGTGPGTFATAYTRYQPPGLEVRFKRAHNDYLQVASDTGLPALVVAGWMILVFYRGAFHRLKNGSALIRGITLGGMSGVTAILFHGLVDFNLFIPANALLFTVLAALTVAPVSPESGQRKSSGDY